MLSGRDLNVEQMDWLKQVAVKDLVLVNAFPDNTFQAKSKNTTTENDNELQYAQLMGAHILAKERVLDALNEEENSKITFDISIQLRQKVKKIIMDLVAKI